MFPFFCRVSLLLIVLLTIGFKSSFAQDKSDTVFYKMIHDDPTFSYFGLGPSFDMSINDHNFTLAAFGLGATYYDFDNRMFATVRSRFHLGEEVTNYNNKGFPDNRSVYEIEKSRDLTVEGTYLIRQSVESKSSYLTLDEKGNTIYITEVDALQATQYGVGAGVRFMSTYYNFGQSELSGIREMDGQELPIQGVSSTYFTQQVLRFSFSRMKVQDFEIVTDKFGNKPYNDFSRVYGGLQLGVGQQLDDVLQIVQLNNGQEIGYRYDINPTVEFLPVGLFVGYESYAGLSDGWGGSFGGKVEIGMLPGPKDYLLSNVYLDFTIFYELGLLTSD